MAQNKINNVLIFGGSSGVGLSVAKLALTQLPNPNIIISSSKPENIDKATAEIKALAGDGTLIGGVVRDLSNKDTQFDDVEAVLKEAKAKFNGLIDHIVWTAGDSFPSGDTARTNEDIIKISTVRVYGPMTLWSLAKDYMNDSRHSSITLSSGALIHRPTPGRGRLLAGGGGVEPGARGLAVDLAPIRVNSIVLGWIQTPLLESHLHGNEAAIEAIKARTLCGTIGTSEEAAEAYLYCMRCAYVTGSAINVEGGSLLM